MKGPKTRIHPLYIHSRVGNVQELATPLRAGGEGLGRINVSIWIQLCMKLRVSPNGTFDGSDNCTPTWA